MRGLLVVVTHTCTPLLATAPTHRNALHVTPQTTQYTHTTHCLHTLIAIHLNGPYISHTKSKWSRRAWFVIELYVIDCERLLHSRQWLTCDWIGNGPWDWTLKNEDPPCVSTCHMHGLSQRYHWPCPNVWEWQLRIAGHYALIRSCVWTWKP